MKTTKAPYIEILFFGESIGLKLSGCHDFQIFAIYIGI